ncbi:MAG: type II toxin-antitoxin system RelE family toxin [Lacisediminihabitans sp.]
MSHQIVLSATARRDLSRIPPRIVPAIIEFVYGNLAAEPRRLGKPLERELLEAFSARRGPYRILYGIDESTETVQILRVAHRSDVYPPR